MRKSSFVLSLALITAVAMVLPACSDDSPTNSTPTEFIASNTDFANYATWTKIAGPLHGPDPAGVLGVWHGGNDTSMSRTIYINNINGVAADRTSAGKFPNGTILVKELRNSSGAVAGVIAMAKRGSTFNTNNNGWEWFNLDSNASITARADTLASNACNGCHHVNAEKDYVFSK